MRIMGVNARPGAQSFPAPLPQCRCYQHLNLGHLFAASVRRQPSAPERDAQLKGRRFFFGGASSKRGSGHTMQDLLCRVLGCGQTAHSVHSYYCSSNARCSGKLPWRLSRTSLFPHAASQGRSGNACSSGGQGSSRVLQQVEGDVTGLCHARACVRGCLPACLLAPKHGASSTFLLMIA